jgi:hypothetical protein
MLRAIKNIMYATVIDLALLSPMHAQALTQSQVDTDINNMLQSCGNGCNSAASLRALADIIVKAMFQQNVGAYIDPVALYSADTTGAVTTGSITSGSNQLTVASAATWSIGQSVAIAGAGPSGAELVTLIDNIVGSVFTIAANASSTVISQNVNHDDTASFASMISLAESTGSPGRMPCGLYNVTGANLLSIPSSILGVSANCVVIQNRGTTNDVFDVEWNWSIPSVTPGGQGGLLSDFAIVQAASVTPTAGYGLNFNVPGGGFCVNPALNGAHVERVNISGMFGGVSISSVLVGWFKDMSIYSTGSGQGIYYNNPPGCGDVLFDGIMMGGNTNTGFKIIASDTMTISNLKLNNGASITFAGVTTATWSNSSIYRVRIVNPSIEGVGAGTNPCAIDFGANGTSEVTITGGELAGYENAYCNGNNNINGASYNVLGYDNTVSGFGVLNIQWPAPVFSGCSSNGTVTPSSGARSGVVTMTCASQTMVMTFPPGSADNGWNCDVHDMSVPSNSILQSGYTAIVNMSTWPVGSPATAIFAGTTTGSSATLSYKCEPW